MMGPFFAFGSLPFMDMHDWARSTSYESRQREQARIARKFNERRYRAEKAAAEARARQREALLQQAKLEQRDFIVASKMPELVENLRIAADDRLEKYLLKLRQRDHLELASRDMWLINPSVFDYQPCELCPDEMAYPKTLPCRGKHQFCEKCIIKRFEESSEKVLKCPTCREDVDQWYMDRKTKICSKQVKAFQKAIKKVIVAAEKQVGIERKWWWSGPTAEEIEAWQFREW